MKKLITLLGLGLAACGADTVAPPEPGQPDANVFEPLTDTLERAQSVQDTVDQRAEELRRRVEQGE